MPILAHGRILLREFFTAEYAEVAEQYNGK